MFDEDFASRVLSDVIFITDVSLEWFEKSFTRRSSILINT